MNNEVNPVQTRKQQEYHFPLKEVIRLMEHVIQSNEFFYPYAGKCDEPGLLLVGDAGVYLMSNGLPKLKDSEDTKRCFVVHALGFDPKKDHDWYENKVYMFGGDDGVEFLPLEEMTQEIERCRVGHMELFTVRFDEEPAGEVASRTIGKIISDDPVDFLNLLLKEPRNVEAMKKRDPNLIKLILWKNFLLKIPQESAKAILSHLILKLPEDQQWLCHTALDLCYDPNVSMDQIYGLDGLEDAIARELKANPEDCFSALKRAFSSVRQED